MIKNIFPVSFFASIVFAVVAASIPVSIAEADDADGNQKGGEDIFNLSLEELGNLTITTASKDKETPQRASSAVTVLTDRDIKRWGIRTIYDALKRVPGFFSSSQATWPLIASRGIVSDGNDHILLLIDGHRQNSIVGQGFQQQDMLPLLDKVERIEIIRGPGSVLWGSSAAIAIINVITRTKGPQNERASVSPAYDSENGLFSTNVMRYFGKEGEAQGMLSATYFEAAGYNVRGKTNSGDAFTREDAQGRTSNNEFPWGLLGNWPAMEQQRDGYEIYGRVKVNSGDEFIGRVLESSYIYPWDSLQGVKSDIRTRKAYFEYKNTSDWNSDVSTDTSVYGDILLQNRFPRKLFVTQPVPNDDYRTQDQSNEETAFGGESVTTIKVTDHNKLKVGAQYIRTKIGPNRDARFNPGTNTPTGQTTDGVTLPYIGVQSGNDDSTAVFAEDSQHLWDDSTTIFGGLRYDYNNFREIKGAVLPRAGIVHSFDENLTGKYVYNTGYLRPNAVYSKSAGVIVDPIRGPTQSLLTVDKSEKVQSHDLEFSWVKDRTAFSATLFYMEITDFISFDAFSNTQGYKNLGDLTSKGIELAAKYDITTRFDMYANYSLAMSKGNRSEHRGALLDGHDRVLNYPRNIWNVGADYLFTDTLSFNADFRGWNDMSIVQPISRANTFGEFGTLSGETYLDLALVSSRVFSLPLDLTLTCTNVFDNQSAVGMMVNDGIYHPRGRSFGVIAKASW